MIKKVIRTICFIVGIIGCLLFIGPYLTFGTRNIGNITGFVVCLAILLYAIFQEKIEQKLNKPVKIIILSIISIIFIIVVVCTGFMIYAATKKPYEPKTLIVLGCRVVGRQPSTMLEERLEAAFRYLSEHRDSVAVLSGGQGADEEISEAECMFSYLTEHGIDANRLYMEDKSTSTKENIAFSHDIIIQQHLSDKIGIVTNEFHAYRALKIAESFGYQAAAIPANTFIFLFPTYYIRELYGILYEWIFA